jgi:manganese transport protein
MMIQFRARIHAMFSTARHHPMLGGADIWKFIGPGFLVTVGFIDPGNWAANVAAGSYYGYNLLWVVTLSTIMLILLQHNVAHLGITTGLCLAEAATVHFRPWVSRALLGSAVVACVSTALAELLGAAIGLDMLVNLFFHRHLPLQIGVLLSAIFVFWMLFSNSYRKVERWIIGFVSLIGLSFLYEVFAAKVQWDQVAYFAVMPNFPSYPLGAVALVMSVLGAVVMPHNLFLHSEVIQSRQWNLQDESVIKRQLNYEFLDTLAAMLVGLAINSAMIILAAATFFAVGTQVQELQQAQQMLVPLLGQFASFVFALALVLAGAASSVTAGMAGGSIFAGLWGEPFDIKDSHTRQGIALTIGVAAIAILFIRNPFWGLIVSQIVLSIQLPWTIFMQLALTASKKVMGQYANTPLLNVALWIVGLIVSGLNLLLLWNYLPWHK